ncbi:hypothetical protein E3U23_10585 [Erythrobacter litoralis]|uniref:cytochrome b/b6 domain-containing protein n=1 Tax=Erythrobacter litoralis TaxID=39960 RepID=UPI002435BEDD|nr:cytochrome b/b6 domain-containing protein [Erythrobacter litoralis]MDG6079641.1 hypothetical protein [Erythrobacter litoralis]
MKRHALSTRLWHWTNLVCVVVMFMSGLTISNAHPRLYWGEWGFAPGQAWLMVPRFPDWMTVPGYYSLAVARDWHILMAWPFALALLFIWIAMLANGHFFRDILTRRTEWAPHNIAKDVKAHLRLDFDHGSGKYNFLQKLTYAIVFGILLPGMVFTGISISPGMEPSFGWVVDLFGGRQSARSFHFIFAFSILGFLILHVTLVMLAGPFKLLRGMITGRQSDEA